MDDIEGLEKLLSDCDTFASQIFDWVGFMGRVDFLHQLYNFRNDIEKKLEALRG
jgi:hypothetical protein